MWGHLTRNLSTSANRHLDDVKRQNLVDTISPDLNLREFDHKSVVHKQNLLVINEL